MFSCVGIWDRHAMSGGLTSLNYEGHGKENQKILQAARTLIIIVKSNQISRETSGLALLGQLLVVLPLSSL